MTLETGFIAILSKEFDKKMRVMKSEDPSFIQFVPRRITSKTVKVLDMKFFAEYFKFLSIRDEELFNDIFYQSENKFRSNLFLAYKSYCFEWPYLAFIFEQNMIFLFSTF